MGYNTSWPRGWPEVFSGASGKFPARYFGSRCALRAPREGRFERSEFLNMTKFKAAAIFKHTIYNVIKYMDFPDPLEIVGLVVGLAGPAHHA